MAGGRLRLAANDATRRPPLRRRRGRRRPDERTEDEPRVNQQIRAPRVLVIDEEGTKLGEFQPYDAVQMARERGLDLVEVAPNANPPVCRIADYGRMRYENSKRSAAARKNQTNTQLKELKVRPKTDDHDMNVKIRRSRSFLEDGNKVKITVWFRGREHAHHDIGADQCYRIADAVEDVGKIETEPRMEGRNMFMILAPLRTGGRKKAAQDEAQEAADAAADAAIDEAAEKAEAVVEPEAAPAAEAPAADAPDSDAT
ncbi:MAG: translation initiation factor IF-3 [Myxococcota bacterium]